MKLNHREIEYKNFGKCLELSNGYLNLIVSLEFGPRILSFSSLDASNIFLEDEDKSKFITSPETVSIFGKDNIFYLRGGHRMWVSPETWYTYYPDNDEVKYDFLGERVIFHQHSQKINGLKQVLEVEFKEENLVSVKQIVKNTDNISKVMGPWSITVMKGPGLEIIPMPIEDTGFVPQRHISFWGYGAKINDKRMYIGDKYSTLYFDTNNFSPYKIGFKVTDNYALYMTEESVFVKNFIFNKDYTYPDNNVNYETYTNGMILEMETVGELKELQPNEKSEHNEFWSIYKNENNIPKHDSEDELDKIIKKYVKKI